VEVGVCFEAHDGGVGDCGFVEVVEAVHYTHDRKEVEVDFANEAAIGSFVDCEVDSTHVSECFHCFICIVRVLHELALGSCESCRAMLR